MSDAIPRMTSRPVVIVPYAPRWVSEFQEIAAAMHAATGDAVCRIDHVGSTSVPGLGAKDVIDVQVTVGDLHRCDAAIDALRQIGYRRGDVIEHEPGALLPPGSPGLAKRYMREPTGARRTHVHIRHEGARNQQMALLFRDYLRATPSARLHYDTIKRRAAALFPTNIDGYMWLKDAPIQLIHEAAVLWAQAAGWSVEQAGNGRPVASPIAAVSDEQGTPDTTHA